MTRHWYFDEELSQLRAELVHTYHEWEAIRPRFDVVTEVPLTPDQRDALLAAMSAERAYLARMTALRDRQIKPPFRER